MWGLVINRGYDWGINFAKDTNTKIDGFLNTMKNTFNPNGVGATGGVKANLLQILILLAK